MISIIVPIYNAAPYLKACMDSLLAQTEKDLQIILVDDSSTDSSLSIAQAYERQDSRVEVYRQAHAGQSVARNTGLAHAKGEFIAFVDADDYIEPDWCQRHLAAMDGVDYVQSGYIQTEGEKKYLPKHPYRFTVVWARLYRKEALQGLRFREGMIYEDILFSIALWLRNSRCRIIRYAGYHYTCNPNSTTALPHPEEQKKVIQELRQKAKESSCKGRLLIGYTVVRLKLHFLLR